ncbi:hypothetical protein PAPHI01_0654 [Pancytospora philotis]|nr:hypothetical protein PAPHI01_0654 [Pancytospora philotis]
MDGGLLDNTELQQIPPQIREKLSSIIGAYQNGLAVCSSAAESAYAETIASLKGELAASTQARIELEMELTKLRTEKREPALQTGSGAAPQGLPTLQFSSTAGDDHGTAFSGRRKYVVLLKNKLRYVRTRLREAQISERKVNLQLETLMSGVKGKGGNESELLSVVKRYALELEDLKFEIAEQKSQIEAYEQGRDQVARMQEEYEELKRNERIYQDEIYSKSSAVMQLENCNADLIAQNGILEQYREGHARMLSMYVATVAKLADANESIKNLRESELAREKLNSAYLMDMNCKEELLARLSGIERVCDGIYSRRCQLSDEEVERKLAKAGRDAEAVQHASRELRRVNWELEQLYYCIDELYQFSKNMHTAFIQGHERVVALQSSLAKDSPANGADLALAAAREELTVARIDNDALKDSLERVSHSLQDQTEMVESMKTQCETAQRDRSDAEERLSINSARLEELEAMAHEHHLETKQFEAAVEDLTAQLRKYKKHGPGHQELVEALRNDLADKEQCVRKQSLLLDRYRKLKELLNKRDQP